MEAGDQIILLIDANEDIRAFAASIQSTGLRDVMIERHGPNAPATYNGGSLPIDGIFASPSISITQGGYLEFGYSSFTDHRCLWVDIPLQNAFGHIMPAIVHHQARRLKTNDPRIVKRYTDSWATFILEHDLLNRAYLVQQACAYPLPAHLQDEIEAIDALRQIGMGLADRKCRKLSTGAVPWSPVVQAARERVELWGLLFKKKGRKTG
jgi:hypothetical protein